jgi:peptidoglycan/LPS O-acetylase OafA/YrhL
VLSYSIYLWQQPFLDRASDGFVHRFPQNLILAFAAALASYYLIEKPFLRLRHRISAARRKRAAA